MSRVFRFLFLAGLLAAGRPLAAAEHIPPAPPRYFNDYAGVVSTGVAHDLNARLEQFERESSSQLLVAIYPRMESASSVEDYTVRVAQAWHAGQKGKDNGAVLFVFMQEHKVYLQVGYGLEGVLPDATAKRIIENEIVPRFRARDVDGGMTAAVTAMIAAAKGEYRGTGRTVAEGRQGQHGGPGVLIVVFFVFLLFLFILSAIIRAGRRARPAVFYNPRRRGVVTPVPPWWMGGGGSGGGFGGGGSFGGGGGFSGGGGSFGGGGAGGSW